MGLTQGDVKITIGVTGKGDTRVVKEAKKDVQELGEKIGTSMKSSVGPLDKVRSGFELVRSNAMFLIGTLTGVAGVVATVVGAVAEFVEGADKGAAATRQWEKDLKGFEAAIDRAWDVLDKSARDPVQEALGQVNAELFKARLTIQDITKGSEEWWDKTRQVRNMEEARTHLESDIARDMERSRDAIRALYGTMKDIDAFGPVQVFQGTSKADDLKMGVNPITGEAETDAMRVAREKRRDEAARRARPRGGGSGKKSAPFAFHDIGTAVDRTGAIGIPSEGGPQESPDWIAEMMAPLPTSIDLATEAMGRFAGALSPVLDEMLPGMAGAIGGLVDIMGAFTSEADKSAKAQVSAAASGAVAVAGGIGQILDGKRGMWIAESIAEGGAAAAAFAVGDLWGGGQHLLASAGYAAAAASAGGSGGGAKSGGSRGGGAFNRSLSDRTNSGNSSVTINTGVYFAGRSDQETAAEMHSMSRRGTGSGFVPRGA